MNEPNKKNIRPRCERERERESVSRNVTAVKSNLLHSTNGNSAVQRFFSAFRFICFSFSSNDSGIRASARKQLQQQRWRWTFIRGAYDLLFFVYFSTSQLFQMLIKYDGFNGSQQSLSLDPKHTQVLKIYREYLPLLAISLNNFQSAKQLSV